MYQCFHYCSNSVCWDSDYSFEDFGYEGEGIVQICHCSNCGAEIEYRISIEDTDAKKDGIKLSLMANEYLKKYNLTEEELFKSLKNSLKILKENN